MGMTWPEAPPRRSLDLSCRSAIATALDLYDYIRNRMPAAGVGPGGLIDPEYLQITAFILNERGVVDGDIDLTIDLADDTLLAPADTSTLAVTRLLAPAPTAAPVRTPAASGNTPPQTPSLIEPATVLLRDGLSTDLRHAADGAVRGRGPGRLPHGDGVRHLGVAPPYAGCGRP